ncbi:MAG TPA: helix-turn-helix transcriptional regulator [Blastocatellia bacterium]
MIELKIDERLAELGKTWYWLAHESGIGHSAAFNLRHHKVQAIRFDALDAICRVLCCQPGDILVRPDERMATKREGDGKHRTAGRLRKA